MKYKKYSYIIVLILMLTIGMTKIHADTDKDCYYMSTDKETLVSYNASKAQFIIEQRGKMSVDSFRKDPLINNGESVTDSGETGITVSAITKGTCPEYIVYRHKSRRILWGLVDIPDSDGVWGFNSKLEATTFNTNSSQIENMSSWLLSYKNEDGSKITNNEFYEQEKQNTSSLSSGNNFGNATGTEVNGEEVNVDCDTIFGDKDNPDSLRYLINEILMYPKIIVPILLILLGMLDFAKAVISSKEDEMKKAQATFIKRVIAAVAVFFIPLLVDIIMGLADIVWAGTGYSSCGL